MIKSLSVKPRTQYRGVATYTQKRICVHIWTKYMGRFNHNSDGKLDVCVQNVCVEPILISLNPILTEFVVPLGITS